MDFLFVYSVVAVIVLCVLYRMGVNAVAGYEDEDGFHYEDEGK